MRRLDIATFAVFLLLALSCGSGTAAQSSAKPSQPAQSGPAMPAAEVDRLLAPVALYPDTLLAQMLLCTADPVKVVELHNWLQKNAALKGTELQDAATVGGFEPEFVALTIFPQVVKYMADNLEWTKSLGKAFAANRASVFDSIQRLRAQASKTGALKDSPQQEVETKTTSSGQQVIVIEPANPQIVYVPQYNPTVVYTQPPTTTVVVQEDDDSSEAVAAGLIGFTAGIAIGAAMDNNYYYGPYGWHGGAYMYNDAWDDYYDAREDAREDWQDHREDLVEERGDRAENRSENRGDLAEERTERQGNRQENRPQSQTATANQQQRRTDAQAAAQSRSTTGTQAGTQSATQRSTTGTQSATQRSSGSYEARGTSSTRPAPQRSGTSSDAFSGYSSGRSERAASSRGSSSRSRSGGGGGGGRRR